MKRGEVWWADLPQPAGRRPVLLVSRDEAYAVRSQVTVASVTTTIRHIPVEVPLGPDEGLPKVCVANLDSLVTISKTSLEQLLTTLPAANMHAADAAIAFALGLPSALTAALPARSGCPPSSAGEKSQPSSPLMELFGGNGLALFSERSRFCTRASLHTLEPARDFRGLRSTRR